MVIDAVSERAPLRTVAGDRRAGRGLPGPERARRPGRPGVGRRVLQGVAATYVLALVLAPLVVVVSRVGQQGTGTFWDSVTGPEAIHAYRLTAQVAGLAVVFNTVFGVGAAILLARHRFPGKRLFDLFIDLPIAVSPIIVGLALVLVYGSQGWFGTTLADAGIQVIYAPLGMAAATAFVSLPLVVREVAPVLVEAGTDQEEAATSLGASALQRFWRITVPTVRWALAYGVVLSTARSLGEFGAVKVVSGNIIGQTQTVTLLVDERAEQLEPGDLQLSIVMILISMLCITIVALTRPKERT
jgi:sulfate/thiosulfate transport system permease protein